MEPFDQLRAGDRIAEKFRVERVLGEGGMGVVYLAVHEVLGERFAIKVLRAEAAGNKEAVTRFVNEARAAIRVKNEHIAAVMDVGHLPDGSAYMVMEYLDGQDLMQVLEARGALPIEETVDYVLQALEGLAYAHAEGIVHRDLKPANLFLTRTRDGEQFVKLLDFGISKLASQQLAASNQAGLTSTAAMLGSPGYMSPEQVRSSRDVDARADLWAIGIILYRLLTGSAPFQGDTLGGVLSSILETKPEPIRTLRADVPLGLEEVIERCLVKDREMRWPNAYALAEALVPFAPPGGSERAERVRRLLRVPSQKRDAATVSEAPRRAEPAAPKASSPPPSSPLVPREPPLQAAQTPADARTQLRDSSPPRRPGSPRRRAPIFAALALGAVVASAGAYFFLKRDVEPRAANVPTASASARPPPSGSVAVARAIPSADSVRPPVPPKIRRDGPIGAGDGGAAANEAAVRLLADRCAQGKTEECIRLAKYYEDGVGVKKDVKHAAQLFEEACEQGVADGCVELGLTLSSGEDGIQEDDARAATFFTKACDLGEALGCTQLGLAFLHGDGVAKDEKRALTLLEKACTAKDGQGCRTLAEAYDEGAIVTSDPARAARYFELGCDQDDRTSCVAFGSRLVKGNGVKQDKERGTRMLQKLCKTSVRACEELAALGIAP